MITWTTLGTRRDWDGDTGGYGRVRIQRGGKGIKKRYYLMSLPWFGSPTVLSVHMSLDEAKDAAETFVEKLK